MNILGRKNKSEWQADFKNKKENHITINNDLGSLVADVMKELVSINSVLKDIHITLKNAMNKIENLEKRVEKLENECKLHH